MTSDQKWTDINLLQNNLISEPRLFSVTLRWSVLSNAQGKFQLANYVHEIQIPNNRIIFFSNLLSIYLLVDTYMDLVF